MVALWMSMLLALSIFALVQLQMQYYAFQSCLLCSLCCQIFSIQFYLFCYFLGTIILWSEDTRSERTEIWNVLWRNQNHCKRIIWITQAQATHLVLIEPLVSDLDSKMFSILSHGFATWIFSLSHLSFILFLIVCFLLSIVAKPAFRSSGVAGGANSSAEIQSLSKEVWTLGSMCLEHFFGTAYIT